MVINCQGTGEPTIILENGYGLYSWPDPGNYPKISRTCSYTRAGMMGPVTGPRTILDQVKDLHQLLAQVGVPGPYILVGHASAGLNLPLYAETYPQEVVGLVCADCFLPTFEAIIVEKLKVKFPNAPDQLQKNLAKVLVYSGYEPSSQEKIDFTASQQQVLKVKSLGSRPVVALVAGLIFSRINVGEIEKECDEAWREAGLKFSQMSTQGRTEVLENDDF